MMLAKVLTDPDLIKVTITNPKIFPYVTDDGSCAKEDYEPNLESFIYVGIYAEEYLGLFVLHQHNHILYEVHTCLLPDAWGEKAIAAAKLLIKWVFENTNCKRLITNVPDNNPLAKRLAKQAGLKQFGINPDSFIKNGVLFDQIMLGVSKEEICQQ